MFSVRQLGTWLMIRPGEGKTLAYLLWLALLNGLGLAFGRGSSDALFFKRFGVEYLPQMFFWTSILLVLFSVVYVEFADRMRPARMAVVIGSLLAVLFAALWYGMAQGVGRIAFAAYFLGVGVAAEILSAHFNLYLTQFFDLNQARRLTPLTDAGARLGRVLGGLLLALMAGHWRTEHAAILWAVLLLAAAAMVALRHRGEAPRRVPSHARPRKPFVDMREGLRFARDSALLKWIGASVFLLMLLVSLQEYVASTIITRHYADDRALAAFFGWFFALTNGAVLLLQLTATGRLVQRFGVKVVNLIFPASTFLSFAGLSLHAGFTAAVWARFNYMGMMPAFRSPVFNLYFAALPPFVQGRARALVVGLIVPLGLACSGLLLLAAPKSMVGEPLALVGLSLAAVYWTIEAKKNRAYGRALLAWIQRQVFTGRELELGKIGRLGDDLACRVRARITGADTIEVARSYARLLAAHAPSHAAELLAEELASLPTPVVELLLRELAPHGHAAWRHALNAALDHPAARVRLTAADLLAARGEAPVGLAAWLDDPNPRLRAGAARLLLRNAQPRLREAATSTGNALLSGAPDARICGLEALAVLGDPDWLLRARALLAEPDRRVRAAAVRCCAALSVDDAERWTILEAAAGDADAMVRIAAAQSLARLHAADRRLALWATLAGDGDFAVRRAAQLATAEGMPKRAAEFDAALRTHCAEFAVQAALCRHLAKTDLVEKTALLRGVAQVHLERALPKLALARRMRAAPGQEAQFLSLVLDEEVLRHLDLVLESLTLLDPAGAMASVRAALNSGNRRLQAQALESLRNTAETPSLRALCGLLDAILDQSPLQARSLAVPDGLPAALSWCVEHGSAWLRECATRLSRAHPAAGRAAPSVSG